MKIFVLSDLGVHTKSSRALFLLLLGPVSSCFYLLLSTSPCILKKKHTMQFSRGFNVLMCEMDQPLV